MRSSNNITMKKIVANVLSEIDLTPTVGVELGKPTFSITFDDGWAGQYNNVFPIFKDRGIRGTFFIIGKPSRMGGKYLTEAQIKEMADAGQEIADHTVNHPEHPTPEQIRDEWLISKPYLESITGKPILTHCYPYGHYTDGVNQIAQGVFEATRGLESKINGKYGSNAYAVDAYSPYYVKRHIDSVIAAGKGVYNTFVMHEVYTDGHPDKPSTRQNVSQFTEWIDYLVEKRNAGIIDIVPYYQGMRLFDSGRLPKIYGATVNK